MSTCLNQNNSETPCAFSEWTDEEQAFRRGFVHGIMAAANGITLEDAQEWRYSDQATCPPGTGMQGVILDGLTKKQDL